MKAIKDAMVLIHLAKITVLEKSCKYFQEVCIPEEVFKETVVKGKEKGLEDAFLIEQLIEASKIKIKKVTDLKLIRMANEFNIFGGEAEALALYRQENAEYLISDDDNLRKKREIVHANIIGSLGVLLMLRRSDKIDKMKFISSIERMRDIGWFSNAVLDKVILEGERR